MLILLHWISYAFNSTVCALCLDQESAAASRVEVVNRLELMAELELLVSGTSQATVHFISRYLVSTSIAHLCLAELHII